MATDEATRAPEDGATGGGDITVPTAEPRSSITDRLFVTGFSKLLRAEFVSEIGLAVALGLLIAIFADKSPYFLTQTNILNVGRAIAPTGIVAAVMTAVLVAGELDLSVGAAMALSGVAAGQVLLAHQPLIVVILAGLAVGVGIGLVNALLVVIIGVNALIATIGTQFAFRGLAYIWTNGIPISTFQFERFAYLGNGTVGAVQFSLILFLATVAVVGFLLSLTKLGSHIYTIGGSRQAARLSGVPVTPVRIAVYLFSATAAALAGLILASSNGSASPVTGTGVELTIISAVILGGTALTGGRGNVVGTCLGVVFLGALTNGMDLVGMQSFWQIFIQGVVLIAAITIDQMFRNRGVQE